MAASVTQSAVKGRVWTQPHSYTIFPSFAPAPGIPTSYYPACPSIIWSCIYFFFYVSRGKQKCEVDLGIKVNKLGLRLTGQSWRDHEGESHIRFYILQSHPKVRPFLFKGHRPSVYLAWIDTAIGLLYSLVFIATNLTKTKQQQKSLTKIYLQTEFQR